MANPNNSSTYEAALIESRKVGASRACGDAHLAQTCLALAHIYAINPKLVFAGARKLSIDGDRLAAMSAVEIGDLMFV